MFKGYACALILLCILSSTENYPIRSSIFKIHTKSKSLNVLLHNNVKNSIDNVPYLKALLNIVPTLKHRFFFPGND